jgi:hypothetical protein
MSSETKTPEELDEQELREVEAGMKEVLDLLSRRQNRKDAGRQLDLRRAALEAHESNGQAAMHIAGSMRVPTTMRTKAKLDLGETLKTNIVLHRHAESLEEALSGLCERHVAVLERILARAKRS